MAEARDTRERGVKWLRRTARIFGPLWALCFALCAPVAGLMIAGLWSLGTGGYMDREMQRWAVRVGNAIVVGGFALAVLPLVSVGIAFRWERVGGVLLLFQGFVLLGLGVCLGLPLFGSGILRGATADWGFSPGTCGGIPSSTWRSVSGSWHSVRRNLVEIKNIGSASSH